jgi:Na+-driven multidrug efflux pump
VIVIDTAISRPMFDRKSLTKLIIPLIAEQFLLIAVGMADTMMVSSVGEAAVSGISLVDPINNLLIQLFAALAAGGSVVCAQYIGKREYDNAGQSAKQLLYAATGLALVIGAIAIAWNAPIIDLIYGALDADVRTNAITYFYLTAASFPFLALYNGERGKLKMKYFFYIFYPAHLVALYLIGMLM